LDLGISAHSTYSRDQSVLKQQNTRAMADDAARVRRELLDDASKRMTAAERVRMRQQHRMQQHQQPQGERSQPLVSDGNRPLDRQQLQQRLEETEAKSSESLKHSLRLAHEAEESGAATMQTMLEQRGNEIMTIFEFRC
jgi:hypothetical protein